MSALSVIRLSDLPGLDPEEAERVGEDVNSRFIEMLSALSPEDWSRETPCERWDVKDVCAHLLGWAEALTSFKELQSQFTRSVKRRKELGNQLDAQNEIQVEDRRHLSTDQLITALEETLPRARTVRRRLGTRLRYLPIYSAPLGGLANVGFAANTIFLRDLLMHRFDIQAATGQDPLFGSGDSRLMQDMLKDWARRSGADVTLELAGDHGGSFVAGGGTAGVVRGELVDLIKLLGGRGSIEPLSIEGDRARIEGWLKVPCPV